MSKPELFIRWLIRRDMPEVMAIEQASFEYPWIEEEFLCVLRQRNCIGMVAETGRHRCGVWKGDRIVGFMIYELHKGCLNVLDFAVAPEHRRQGIGSEMVRRLVSKLCLQKRRRILLEIRERNLAGQLFFHSQGFRALRVLPDHYDDITEDAYQMRYLLCEEERGKFLEDYQGPMWADDGTEPHRFVK